MAAHEAPTPAPLRPSTLERERVVQSLKDHAVAGRLSVDTLAARVEQALAATSRGQLEVLHEGLSPAGVRGWILRSVRATSGFFADLATEWRDARVPKLGLTADERELVLGRSRTCDCTIPHETVSRRHAAVRWTGRSWILRDLESLNGVQVNGWRVVREAEIRPGDRVSLGEATYRIVQAH